jgi:hypothetical protein
MNADNSRGLADDFDMRAAQLVAAMWGMVDAAAGSERVQALAAAVASLAPQRDFEGQLRYLDAWIRRAVRFKRDTWRRQSSETIRDPETLIREAETNPSGATAADCDDVAALGASVVQAMGHEPVIITVRAAAGRPWHHVYFGALVRSGGVRVLVPMDPQQRTPVGKWAPGTRDVAVWRMGGGAPMLLRPNSRT